MNLTQKDVEEPAASNSLRHPALMSLCLYTVSLYCSITHFLKLFNIYSELFIFICFQFALRKCVGLPQTPKHCFGRALR